MSLKSFPALSDDSVWADGLLIFHEIFKFLEEAMTRTSNSLIGELDVQGMRRADAFKQDLTYYMGRGWERNYQPRPEVAEYIQYLKKLEETEPHLLMAYIYHLYMGLLSGGQILQKKRQIFSKYMPSFGKAKNVETDGFAVTTYNTKSISQLKRELVKKMNEVAGELDEPTRQKLISESRTVFIRNNQIIKTVKGATEAFMKKNLIILAAVFFVALAIVYISQPYF